MNEITLIILSLLLLLSVNINCDLLTPPTLDNIPFRSPLPQLLIYSNKEILQPHLQQIFIKNKNSTQIIIQLTDSNTYLIPVPDDEYDGGGNDDDGGDDDEVIITKDSYGVPLQWIEFYIEDLTTEIDMNGITVLIHETINNPHAFGEIAYTWSILKKLAFEYDVTLSLYTGFYFVIGLLTGGRLSPEFDLLSSMSIMYSCSVRAGKTIELKIYPTIANLTPYYKKLNWNEKLQKFMFKKSFTKHQRMKLLALTGLEDVECLYVE